MGGWGVIKGAKWDEGQLSQASYVRDPLLYLLRTHPGATLPNATFCLIPGHGPDALHFLQALQVQRQARHPLALSPDTPELAGSPALGRWEGTVSCGHPRSPHLCRAKPTAPKNRLSLLFTPCPQPKQLLIWNWGRGSVCRVRVGSPVPLLSPRLAASLCFSALGGSCPSPRSSIGPRRPS